MDQQNILYMLNYLREQSECIDKQVSCIITDKDDNVLSMGWNLVEACDFNCHDKENRICSTVHAEVIALGSLSTRLKKETIKAYVSLYPCIACQKVCEEAGIKEIISFTEDHKGRVFENITFAENINYKLLNSNAVDTLNTLKYSADNISDIIKSSYSLIKDLYTITKNKSEYPDSMLKSIADMELQLEQLKLILWSKDPEFYNKMRVARSIRRRTILRNL